MGLQTLKQELWARSKDELIGIIVNQHDLVREVQEVLLAIGSICRRGQTKEIRKIILAIRDNLPDFVHLHGFGVKISALRYPDVYDALYSIDSGAWDYTARWNKLKGNVDSSEASLLAAQNYLKKFEGIRDLHENQLKLEV